jgi:uncharacterized protein DUF955
VRWVADRSGRLVERPHYDPAEIDSECESIVGSYLRRRHGAARFPLSTNDLTLLLEQSVEDLDLFANLTVEGEDVEGVTIFVPKQRPIVRIARELSDDASREHRLRTTLAHELGHVKLHAFLWAFGGSQALRPRCRRQSILGARTSDWLEWQAGYASGALLMPSGALQEVVTRTQAGEASSRGPLDRGGPAARRLVSAVQSAFQVSHEAARLRLIQRGYLTRRPISRAVVPAARLVVA